LGLESDRLFPPLSMPKKLKKAKASPKKKAKKLKKAMRRSVKKIKKVTKKTAKKVRKLKKVTKKTVKAKASSSRKMVVRQIAEKVIGKVTHYYDRIGVAVVALQSPIRLGDTIRMKHGESAFDQKIESLQFNHAPIAVANAGEEVGMKVDQLATEGTLLIKP